MSEARVTIAVYRRAVRLYPRPFREDYGDDLVQLLEDQLRDERSMRVAARCAVDLALTLPTRHLETHMHNSPRSLTPLLFGALGLSALIVVGHPLVLVACLAVGGGAACLALLSIHRARALAVAASAPASAHWWKVLAAGAGLMAALVAITTAIGELPDHGWLVAMITGLTAIVLMSLGAVLGVTHLATRPSRRAIT